ncbi:MAG: inositol monophosphatase family protein [Nanobdellota archaeon]
MNCCQVVGKHFSQLVEHIRHLGDDVLFCSFGARFKSLSSSDIILPFDLSLEDSLVDLVKVFFPDSTVYAEEQFKKERVAINPGSDFECFIDALDGSENYSLGIPFYAISLAFRFKGELVAGIVYEPMRKNMYTAFAGKGAFRNGKRIHINNRKFTSRRFSMVSADRVVSALESKFSSIIAASRHFGLKLGGLSSSALDLCYTAFGSFAGMAKSISFTGSTPHLWGVAAGILFCREAGLLVSDASGRPFNDRSDSLLVTHPELYKKFFYRTPESELKIRESPADMCS